MLPLDVSLPQKCAGEGDGKRETGGGGGGGILSFVIVPLFHNLTKQLLLPYLGQMQ